MRFTQHDARKTDDRGLFGQRPAVGEHAKGRLLQLHVVGEAKRRPEADIGRRPLAERLETLAGSRVRRYDDRQLVLGA